MPEGPETRRAAEKIARKLVDQVVERVWFRPPRLQPFVSRLQGSRVIDLETRGKAMLIHFESALCLYTHNQLYGRWFVRARDSYPKTNRSLRVALHTKTTSALLYSASEIEVLDEAGIAAHPFLAKLGPDLLAPELTERTIRARLRTMPFSGRALGSLYLDQGFIAGVGNYLRSEILHFARLHPRHKPRELSATQQRKLAAETLRVGRRAYEQRGVTNPARLAARLKKKGGGRRSYRHAVFGRAGLPCHRCETPIEKATVASRRLYLCPACQQ